MSPSINRLTLSLSVGSITMAWCSSSVNLVSYWVTVVDPLIEALKLSPIGLSLSNREKLL